MPSNIDFYIESIRNELEQLTQGRFTGNVEFKPNFKDGSIANMNVSLHKSIKKPEASSAE